MKIEHIALWTNDLEMMKNFYVNYLSMQCSTKYYNPSKNFTSYFLSFPNESTRIELMHRPDVVFTNNESSMMVGLTHLAFSVGTMEKVDELTEQLRNGGFNIISEPRTTGDGYYESQILDPEGNIIEITV